MLLKIAELDMLPKIAELDILPKMLYEFEVITQGISIWTSQHQSLLKNTSESD